MSMFYRTRDPNVVSNILMHCPPQICLISSYNESMAVPILATKLFTPPTRSELVLRPRLIEQLNKGLLSSCKLTLVSAPAGFGKTTLVSKWIADCQKPVAWLSLDEGDNDPARFISYLIAALQTIKVGIGDGLLTALQSHQPPAIESILTFLLNEITSIPDNLILVMDDYHVIDSKPVDDALTFLLEHQPPKFHLVIATREDPNVPVARLRVRGQLTELRAADLRFTPAEAAEFLNRMMGLNLSNKDIAALEARTEGWIAGLQMAALSMQGREDIATFIRAFTGSHRFVLDYLAEEVLQRQPESSRNFLLQTAILERFCAPLCNAVTEREDSKEMLSTLEDGNLFIVPLDDQRQWYRYHHLFAEVLQSYLHQEQPDQVPMLHRRAGIWFEDNHLIDDAIPHTLAAKDFERAANLIERVWREKDITYQYDAWLRWVKSLPDELVRTHPVICVGYAWALLGTGELEASEARLLDAERWLQSAGSSSEISSSRMIVADEKEFRSLPASISAARTYHALALGDIPRTKKYALQTLTLAPDETTLYHTQATALLALAEYANGDLQEAEQDLLKFQAMMWNNNDLASAIGITFALANIKLVQGCLREAVIAYQQSLQVAANRGATFFIGMSDLHRGLSELLCEQNDLEAASQLLLTAQQTGEKGATTGWQQRLCVSQARLKASQGELAQALAYLEEAERQYIQNPLPDPPIAALKARIWVRQGRLIEAFSWVREQNLSPEDELSFIREFEHLTLARMLIARYKADQVNDDLHAALGLLERLLQAAEAGGRNGSVIEILILQALAYQAQGNHSRAFAPLEHALSLAGPEGYVRIFVDEGEAMRLLILNFRSMLEEREHPSIHPLLGYVNRLFATFPESQEAITQSKIVNRKSEIAEPLSERELDVLKLLRSELSGPEIAEQLIVSLNTLRTHTKSIFNKLGVNNRRAAVRRAEELNLL
jgi:LuxR family transcriptional regulator, maltose regulon positive regulatory protein